MGEAFEGQVRDKFGVFEGKVRDGGFVLSFEPVSDGLSFVGVSIGGDDGFVDHGFRNGTGPLLFEGLDKELVLAIHINNFYKVYQIKVKIYSCNMIYHTR